MGSCAHAAAPQPCPRSIVNNGLCAGEATPLARAETARNPNSIGSSAQTVPIGQSCRTPQIMVRLQGAWARLDGTNRLHEDRPTDAV